MMNVTMRSELTRQVISYRRLLGGYNMAIGHWFSDKRMPLPKSSNIDPGIKLSDGYEH